MKTCADFGGTTRSGEPCGRRVKDGKCRDHTGEADATLQAEKSEVLDLLNDGEQTLADVARAVGRDPATLWRWRKADPEFDEAVTEALEDGEKLRISLVEDSLFSRILRGEASGTETIFWLQNRAPERWKDKRHHEHSGEIDTGGDVHVYLPDNRREQLPEQIRKRAELVSGNGAKANGGGG